MKKSPFEKHIEKQRKGINNLMKAFAAASNTKKGTAK